MENEQTETPKKVRSPNRGLLLALDHKAKAELARRHAQEFEEIRKQLGFVPGQPAIPPKVIVPSGGAVSPPTPSSSVSSTPDPQHEPRSAVEALRQEQAKVKQP